MNSLKNKIHKRIFLIGIIIIVIVFILSFISKAKTTNATALLPFGGQVTELFYCSCSANYAVTVGSPRGGVFSYYDGGTRVYENGPPRVGVWALGTYYAGGECLIPYGEVCAPSVAQVPIGIMSQVGTSMTL